MFIKQTDEIAGFFTCWYKFMDRKILLKNIGMGVIINDGFGHSGHRI